VLFANLRDLPTLFQMSPELLVQCHQCESNLLTEEWKKHGIAAADPISRLHDNLASNYHPTIPGCINQYWDSHSMAPHPSPPAGPINSQGDLMADSNAVTHPCIIGLILSNGISRHDQYKCHIPSCTGATFSQLVEFKRHNASRYDKHRARSGALLMAVSAA
jgi:hypothetical protein